jgi:hypothetical protein
MSIRKIEDSEKFRKEICNRLSTFFNNERHALNLEKGIHNWSLKEATNRKVVKKWDNPHFVCIYLNHLKSIYINLKKNQEIVNNVNNGLMKAHLIAFMTHQEFCPEKWESLIQSKIC